jgi:hypothetical protein
MAGIVAHDSSGDNDANRLLAAKLDHQ